MTKLLDLKVRFDRNDTVFRRARFSQDRVNQLFAGADLTFSELRSLANALRVPVRDLIEPESSDEAQLDMMFRDSKAVDDAQAQVALRSLSSRIERLAKLLRDEITVSGSREWRREFSTFPNDYGGAELAAQKFRQLFFFDDTVGPITKLPGIVCQLGIALFTLNSSRIEAAAVYRYGVPFIFVSRRFPPRMLFSLAHELAHLILHLHPDQERDMQVDLIGNIGRFGSKSSSAREMEFFADAFASCLLVPPMGVGIFLSALRERLGVNAESLVTDIEVLLLAQRYGVSFQVAARRLEDLRLLPARGGTALYKHVVATFGSPEKMAAGLGVELREDVKFERQCRFVSDALSRKLDSGEVSIGRLAELLDSPISVLRKGKPS